MVIQQFFCYLSSSLHLGYINVIPIDFGKLGDQPWVPFKSFFTRAELKIPQTWGHSYIQYTGTNASCSSYNPWSSRQVLCQNCQEWVDFDTSKTTTCQGKHSDAITLLERLQDLPVLRGGGWLNAREYNDIWEKVNNDYGKKVARSWLIGGTYEVLKSDLDRKEVAAAVMFMDEVAKDMFFICSICKHNI